MEGVEVKRQALTPVTYVSILVPLAASGILKEGPPEAKRCVFLRQREEV